MKQAREMLGTDQRSKIEENYSDLLNVRIGDKGNNHPASKTIKKLKSKAGEVSSAKKEEAPPLVVIDGVAIKDEQIAKFKDFDSEISKMVSSEKKQSENNTITLLILQELVRKYFTCPATLQDPVAALV